MGRKTKLMARTSSFTLLEVEARSLQLLQSRGPGEYKKVLDVRVCSHLGSLLEMNKHSLPSKAKNSEPKHGQHVPPLSRPS